MTSYRDHYRRNLKTFAHCRGIVTVSGKSVLELIAKRIQARTSTQALFSTSFQSESHPVPLGPLDPLGQLLKDRKKGEHFLKRDTVSTTHLALSEPRGTPDTAGEPSPLGRRRTRGLFVREGERELACNDPIGEVPGVAQAVGAFRGNNGSVAEEPSRVCARSSETTNT